MFVEQILQSLSNGFNGGNCLMCESLDLPEITFQSHERDNFILLPIPKIAVEKKPTKY